MKISVQNSSLLIIFVASLVPTMVLAATAPQFVPLEGIPGMSNLSNLSTEGYIQALYDLSITLAALLAVIKIIFAGVKYMLSEIVTDKASAKKDIQGAILGLLIILAAVTLLNTINPELTKLNALRNAPQTNVSGSNGSDSSSLSVGTVVNAQ